MNEKKGLYLCVSNFENEDNPKKNFSKFVRIVHYAKEKDKQQINGSFLDSQKSNDVYVNELFDVGTIKELHVANSVTIVD